MRYQRILLAAGLWVGVTAATAAATPGCYGHNCDGSFVDFGGTPQGEMIDANTWESNPFDGQWLPFPGQRTYNFDLSLLGNRRPTITIPFISAQEAPIVSGDNYTIGSGNLAEFWYNPGTNTLTIQNGTCADYFLYLAVTAADTGTDTTTPATQGGD
ncbi:MAG: hypothetical protein FWD69_06105 [Polyangiaceae bacterium]|nr:hypothetical protein [Polyangiaceae bacterium]